MGRFFFFAAACGRQLRRLAKPVIIILYRGQARFCPVCEKRSRKFLAFSGRHDARCPRCGALERHRLVWLYFSAKTDLLSGAPRQLLHVAPEPCLESRLKKRLGENYLSADLSRPRAMVKVDVTAMPFPDDTFDAIYCSHVLEHVADDRKAMREFYRVLKPGAWAVLLVPISAARTVEDPLIVKPSERRKAFGQEDHVRRYGPDYADRLREAGFRVEITRAPDMADGDEIERMGLTPASGEIYCGFKS
jgi:SAM-dependent methyltransferase